MVGGHRMVGEKFVTGWGELGWAVLVFAAGVWWGVWLGWRLGKDSRFQRELLEWVEKNL
jgi:hypothetical protein